MKKWLMLLWLFCALPAMAEVDYLDLPPCDSLLAVDGQYRLGIAQPMNNADLGARLVELGGFYKDLGTCRVEWRQILPRFTPWSPVPELEKYYGYGLFALALVVVSLLYSLLPKSWRRQVTLLGILGVVSLTWLLGSGGLLLAQKLGLPQKYLYKEVMMLQDSESQPQWFEVAGVWDLDQKLMSMNLKPDEMTEYLHQRPEIAQAADSTPAANPVAVQPTGEHKIEAGQLMREVTVNNTQTRLWVPSRELASRPNTLDPVGQDFIVHRAANIRQRPGVQHPRLDISPLHRGTRVTVIGPVQGDWWKVRVSDSGVEGWMSSLWLRLPEEEGKPSRAPRGKVNPS